jgi:hypothetical protein
VGAKANGSFGKQASFQVKLQSAKEIRAYHFQNVWNSLPLQYEQETQCLKPAQRCSVVFFFLTCLPRFFCQIHLQTRMIVIFHNAHISNDCSKYMLKSPKLIFF